MATIQSVNNGDSGLVARTKINNNDANINAALQAAEALLTTDNASLDDFQKITDAIEAIELTLSVDDVNYDTLQEIVDKLKAAETKLASIATNAEENVQANWNQTDNTQDDFIQNKPTFGDISDKDVGTAIGNIQENGAILGNSQTVETDATGKFITAAKNTAYNKDFGTGNTDVARGDASYVKNDTYTKAEANALLLNKEDTSDKGQASGYASLDSNAQVPLAQLPANAKSSKVVADITARDAIASADRFEGLRVHVLNATADTTVSSGGAGYILKSGLANTDWEKTYESESVDIDLSDYFDKTTDTTDDITEGTAKFTTQSDIDKLSGIEANATADQTDAEIKTAYEANANTNAFTDAEQTKLAGIDSGATANSTDAFLLARANHTGTQTLATISDSGALAGKDTIATADVDNNAITTTKIQQFASKTVVGRTSAGTGDVEEIDIATTLKTDLSLTSGDVGLGNVDNTSDADKPVSTEQQTALDGKLAKASNFTDLDSRQTALDNLTDVVTANDEDVLTRDTSTGNTLFKPIPKLLPTGSLIMSIASSLSGALKFDGVSSYSKTDYSSLYTILSNIVGTAFDVDADNFYLPDPAGRVLGVAGSGRTLFDLAGSDTHSLLVAEIPTHTHNLKLRRDEGSQVYTGFVPDENFANSFGRNTSNNNQDAGTLLTDRGPNAISHTTESVGSGQAHNIVQKTVYIAENLFIYY